jgi:uncharacterized small protein (DUF1192 family)
MAKALVGHFGGDVSQLSLDNARLRARVQALQAEIAELRAQNDALVSAKAEALIESAAPQLV